MTRVVIYFPFFSFYFYLPLHGHFNKQVLGDSHLVVVVADGEEQVSASSARPPPADSMLLRTPDPESRSLPCPPLSIQQGRCTRRRASSPAMVLGLERSESTPSDSGGGFPDRSAPTTVGPGEVLGLETPPSMRGRAFDTDAGEALGAALDG